MIRNSGHEDGDFVFVRSGVSRSSGGILPPLHDKWALLVGVSQFASKNIPPLPFVSSDVSRVFSALADPAIGRFPKEHITVLPANATSVQIHAALNLLVRRAEPDDMALVYLAGQIASFGHTYGPSSVPYLLTYDTDISSRDSLFATAVPFIDLLGTVSKRARSSRTLMLLDTSYSAPYIELPPGAALICARTRDEQAYETKAGGGLLTYYPMACSRRLNFSARLLPVSRQPRAL